MTTPIISHTPLEHANGMDYRNGILTELKRATDSVLYNRQHNWMLFTSLTLMMAKRLDQKEKTGTVHVLIIILVIIIRVQWNLSIPDTIGTAQSVLIKEVSSFQR